MLPPYDPEAICPKCGHEEVTVAYVASHTSYSSPRCGGTHLTHKYTEHLDRHCQRCHYEWAESVIEQHAAGPARTGGE